MSQVKIPTNKKLTNQNTSFSIGEMKRGRNGWNVDDGKSKIRKKIDDDDFPEDVYLNIFAFCDFTTLGLFRLVSKTAYRLVRDDRFGTPISKADKVVETFNWQFQSIGWNDVTTIYKHIQAKIENEFKLTWEKHAKQYMHKIGQFGRHDIRLIYDSDPELRFLIFEDNLGVNLTMKTREVYVDDDTTVRSIRFGYRRYQPRLYPNGERLDHDHHYVIDNDENEQEYELLTIESTDYIKTSSLHIDTRNTDGYITYGEQLGEHLTDLCFLLGVDKTNRIILLGLILNLCSLEKFGYLPTYLYDFNNQIIGECSNSVVKKSIGNIWNIGLNRDVREWFNGGYKDLEWNDRMDEGYEELGTDGSEFDDDDDTGPVVYTREDRPSSKYTRY